MPRLPNIRVALNHGWYLAPHGSMGSEALVYLPAFNEEVRAYYENKGYTLLSDARGNTFTSDAALAIRPPSDESVRWAIARMEERAAADLADVREKVAEAKAALKDDLLEPSERKVWRAKLKALSDRQQQIQEGRPTFAELKRYFLREYRLRVAAAQSQDVRRTLALHAHEQEIAAEMAILEAEERRGRKEALAGEAQPV